MNATIGSRSRRLVFATVVVMVGAAGVVQSALATPVITATPSSFGSGQTVTVAGTGFAADQVVNVWFDGNGNTVQDSSEPSDSRTATAAGVFSGASFVAKGYEGSYFVRAGTPADNAFSDVHIGSCWFNDCFINGQDTICLLGN